MDVRCPACTVEYEFDDDKVTAAGVTVKCTSCGHVFKVKKEGAAPALDLPDAQEKGGDWVIRQQSGRSFRFKELTTLQKWIVEQKVSRDDQISKTGQTWKALGEIAELASFFQVVDAARSAQQMAAFGGAPPSPQAPGGSPPGSLPPGSLPPGYGSYPPGSVPPGYGPYASYPPGYPPQGHGQGPAPTVPTPPGVPVPSLYPGYPLGVYPPGMVPGQGYPSPPQGAPNPVGQAVGSYPPGHRPTLETVFDAGHVHGQLRGRLDDDDPVAQWQRRGRGWKIAVVLVVLLVGGGVGVHFARPDLTAPVVEKVTAEVQRLLGRKAAPLDPAVVSSSSVVASADPGRIEAALESLVPAVTTGDPAALSAASRLHTLRARLLADQAFVATFTRLESAPGDVRTSLQTAYQLAGKALQGTSSPRGHLASADYQAASGALSEMEADLKAATAHPDADAATAHEAAVIRVQGRALALRVAAESRRDGARAALDAAEQDPALAGGDDRAAFASVLARAAAGDDSAALRPKLSSLGQHPGFGAMANAVDAALAKGPIKLAPPAATNAGPREGPSDGPKDGASKDGATDNDDEEATRAREDDDGPSGGAKPRARDDERTKRESYTSLVERGKRLQLNGRSKNALALFKKAADLNGGDPRAHVGIGWANFDLGKQSAAVAAFKRALAEDAGAAEAHLALGEAYRADGKKAEAKVHFKRYLELAPSGPDASVARQALEQLK